jgi:EAL domain-containing protein (putative c-di-GMP-specific phosphodiesterase class I)
VLSDTARRPIQLAVNLSSSQFRDPRFLDLVDATVVNGGFDPASLEFEITESTLMESVPATINTLQALTDRGIRIAVDDFGTGYSSLSYLRRFSVDTIKIDRSFVWDAPRNSDAAAIVKAVISLGRELEMMVVAEGVETAEQLEFLRSLHCSRVQGYLFSPPATLDDVATMLLSTPGWAASVPGSR